MISVKEANDILRKHKLMLSTEVVLLHDCNGRVSAQTMVAPFDVPMFDKSMMDGYAFRYEDFDQQNIIRVQYGVQAGTTSLTSLEKGEAARIFTGAPIPANADTVVPQEDVIVENGCLLFEKPVVRGGNIAKQGSQTPKGSVILESGIKLTPEYIGFLATFGISQCIVYALPKIGIISTGKELIPPGQTLAHHQIYDSNSVFLKVALKELGIHPVFAVWADDEKEDLKAVLEEKIPQVDVLICTGGVSVGDYDFVKPVLEEAGAEILLYKVRQKPGKPLLVARVSDTMIFALPGNPGSVVACYHVYLKPFLLSQFGHAGQEDKNYAFLSQPYTKKAGLTHFVKAYLHGDHVDILPNQMSYQMDAYAKANAFAVLDEEQEIFSYDQKVEVIKFRI